MIAKNQIFCRPVALALLAAAFLVPGILRAQGTAFTYQGRLLDQGNPANGNYDLAISVWNAADAGALVAGRRTNSAVAVTGGLFTITLDYGPGIFNGQSRWLEISVRSNGLDGFRLLAPRQPCTAVPYSILAASALTAGSIIGSVPASQITGTLSAGNIGDGTVSAGSLAPNAAAANLNAAGQSGVASGGLVLSTVETNTNLLNAGYVKIYGAFGTPDAWQAYPAAAAAAGPPAGRGSHSAVWTGTEMIIWGGYGGSFFNDGGRYNPAVNSWTPLPVTGTTPRGRLNHTAIWTGGGMIVWGGIGGTNQFNDGGVYDPVLNRWNYIPNTLLNTPSPRQHHTALWTGSAMIVWGGQGDHVLNDGARYNPGLNSWTYLPGNLPNTPAARASHTAVWSGSEMIVWGGFDNEPATYFRDGGRYDPVANQWTTIANDLPNSPAARQLHSAVWTGNQMVVWGGAGAGGDFNDGGRFDPVANTWTGISGGLANAPAAREAHTAVWTGTEMIIWGGYLGGTATLANDGARFNPLANAWVALPKTLPNTPVPRWLHTAVWTGQEMIIWGGSTGVSPVNDGGRFDPVSGTWRYLPQTVGNTPPPRAGHSAIWTGAEMIIWGGANDASVLGDGGRFNPALNSWVYLAGNLANSPSARSAHTAVWTGGEMIIWGGFNGFTYLGDGGRFNPVSGNWTALPATLPNTPSARASHTAVWTGTQMILWGGLGAPGNVGDGGRFNPTSGTWAPIDASLPNTPGPRANHTMVWTDTETIVWGGNAAGNCFANGGRYDPSLNRWTYLGNTLPNTPGPRSFHTAVWTGKTMIIWGGAGCGSAGEFADGGLFNPDSNTWTALASTLPNTPAARHSHSSVWTGNEMIIWGGTNATTAFADGARYQPGQNTWTSIPNTLANPPAARSQHTAVWTGNQMLIWGGVANGYFNDTFGLVPGRVLYLYQRP